MTASQLDLCVHLGCWGNISTYAQTSTNVRSEETRDTRAHYWCLGPVVGRFQYSFLIFYKQPQQKLPIPDIL